MTSKERREKGMLFIADDKDWAARQLTQALNNIDRCDFEGIYSLVKELFGKADEKYSTIIRTQDINFAQL